MEAHGRGDQRDYFARLKFSFPLPELIDLIFERMGGGEAFQGRVER